MLTSATADMSVYYGKYGILCEKKKKVLAFLDFE
jgi:hypothetical protein